MDSPAAPDHELITRSQAGNLDAFETLVRRHQARIYNLTYRLTGNREDATDAAQDAFVRAFQALPRFRQASTFSTWLHRIATNAALDLLRRRPAVPPVEVPVDHPAPSDPETEAQRREVGRRIHAALGLVPVEFRAAVVLVDLQGLSYEEAATVLAVPVGTIRSRLSRGREAMRVHLADLVASER